MIGSPYESCPIKTVAVPMVVAAFTDDTVLTIAVANAINRCKDYETAVKNAISLGGDADTMACIAAGIAQAYYKTIHPDIVWQVRRNLPDALLAVLDQFNERFDCPY